MVGSRCQHFNFQGFWAWKAVQRDDDDELGWADFWSRAQFFKQAGFALTEISSERLTWIKSCDTESRREWLKRKKSWVLFGVQSSFSQRSRLSQKWNKLDELKESGQTLRAAIEKFRTKGTRRFDKQLQRVAAKNLLKLGYLGTRWGIGPLI